MKSLQQILRVTSYKKKPYFDLKRQEKQETGNPAGKHTLKGLKVKYQSSRLSKSTTPMNFRRRPRNDLGHCKVCCAYDLITQSLDFSFLHSSSALWCERVVGVDITARIFGYAMLMRPTNKVHTTGLVQACVHWLQTLFGVNVSGGPVTLCPSSSTQTP